MVFVVSEKCVYIQAFVSLCTTCSVSLFIGPLAGKCRVLVLGGSSRCQSVHGPICVQVSVSSCSGLAWCCSPRVSFISKCLATQELFLCYLGMFEA
jgi:hypothetical protein